MRVNKIAPHRLLSLIDSKYPRGTRQNLKHYSSKTRECFNVTVVGGGIVGVAAARELLLRFPSLRIAIIEKESKLASHQSGHNSGVIHAGIYYKPGSLKAKLCVEGMNLAYEYFDEKNIPYKKCGKLIVATNKREDKRLDDLYERGLLNKVPDMTAIEGRDIPHIEPNCQGLRAIHSPHTGIVDWAEVTRHFAQDFTLSGGKIFLDFPVTGFDEACSEEYPVIVQSKCKNIRSQFVLTCGGLHSDVLSEMSGCSREPRIIPFRGEYLLLKPSKSNLVRGNIYPVPDPTFPFLGVHFTPRMDGSVWLGPNAVLAFKREGYRWSDVNLEEFSDIARYPGFRRLAFRYLGYGTREMLKSGISRLQVAELQKFVPSLKPSDVMPGPAGVRAQALDAKGNLVDDFVFDIGRSSVGKRILHCRNAPSPGATSSMAIARLIADKVIEEFKLH